MILKKCRICHGSNLIPYLNLGFTPPADSFLKKEGLQESETHYPLEVYLCNECGMSQLGFTVPPEILYQNNYPYESSITLSGRTHFLNFATSIVKRFDLKQNDLAIDIGSNVGVLLDGFKVNGCKVLGIEPSTNISAKAIERGIETINDFISPALAKNVISKYGKASVVTGTNVFAHIHDLDAFVEAIDILLNEMGILVIEAPHFLNLIRSIEYDTIYHEHLLYISVRPLNMLFNRFGFEVFDVEENGIHGGSIRIYVCRLGTHQIKQALIDIIRTEEDNKLFDYERLLEFSNQVADHRIKLMTLLNSLKAKGASLAGVSAPAKGMTLLNYCHIGPDLLDFMTEKSKLKIGLYTPGTHISILPDESLFEKQPDYALLLAWNFADEIMENLKEYRSKGGRFIIPIPEPRIV